MRGRQIYPVQGFVETGVVANHSFVTSRVFGSRRRDAPHNFTGATMVWWGCDDQGGEELEGYDGSDVAAEVLKADLQASKPLVEPHFQSQAATEGDPDARGSAVDPMSELFDTVYGDVAADNPGIYEPDCADLAILQTRFELEANMCQGRRRHTHQGQTQRPTTINDRLCLLSGWRLWRRCAPPCHSQTEPC